MLPALKSRCTMPFSQSHLCADIVRKHTVDMERKGCHASNNRIEHFHELKLVMIPPQRFSKGLEDNAMQSLIRRFREVWVVGATEPSNMSYVELSPCLRVEATEDVVAVQTLSNL